MSLCRNLVHFRFKHELMSLTFVHINAGCEGLMSSVSQSILYYNTLTLWGGTPAQWQHNKHLKSGSSSMAQFVRYHPDTANTPTAVPAHGSEQGSGHPRLLMPHCSGDQLGRRGKWPVSDSLISSIAPLKCLISSPAFFPSVSGYSCLHRPFFSQLIPYVAFVFPLWFLPSLSSSLSLSLCVKVIEV